MNRPGTASRWCVALMLTGLALFATGVVRRPGGEHWALAYDLGLYNCDPLLAALCWQAARRVPAERLAWLAVAVALLFSAAGDVTFTLVISRLPEEPFPSLADAFWLAYPLSRRSGRPDPGPGAAVPHQHVAGRDHRRPRRGRGRGRVLLGPSLALTDGDPAAVITDLAYPVADVLLLALLVSVGAILGVRRDPTLLPRPGDDVQPGRRRRLSEPDGPGSLHRRRPARPHLAGRHRPMGLAATHAAPGRPTSGLPDRRPRASGGGCWRFP